MSERLKRKNDQQQISNIVEKKSRIGGGGGRRAGEGSGDPTGVTFSPLERSSTLYLSRDQRTATCTKGYRMVKATHGVQNGKWYCEFQITPDLKPGAHVRLGWANESADVHGPVGFDQHSYAYRDEGGSRVHQSIRTSYGQSYGAGDVIGCLINFETTDEEIKAAELKDEGASVGPADGLRQSKARELATFPDTNRAMIEQILFSKEPAKKYTNNNNNNNNGSSSSSSANTTNVTTVTDTHGSSNIASSTQPSTATVASSVPPPNSKHVVNQRYWNSSIQFFVNGIDQGIAYIHLTKEGQYYPAVSLYMGAAVRFNPGPNFTFPLPSTLTIDNNNTTNNNGKVRPISDLEHMSSTSSSSSLNNHFTSLHNGSSTRPSSSTVIDIAANLQLLQRGTGPPTSLDIPYNFTGTQFAYTGSNNTGSTSNTNSNSSSSGNNNNNSSNTNDNGGSSNAGTLTTTNKRKNTTANAGTSSSSSSTVHMGTTTNNNNNNPSGSSGKK